MERDLSSLQWANDTRCVCVHVCACVCLSVQILWTLILSCVSQKGTPPYSGYQCSPSLLLVCAVGIFESSNGQPAQH